MTAAFKTALPSTQKFVLVALCDSANDQGECYPSVTALMSKCSLSDRGVQKALIELESAGFVRREFRTGRSTVYWVTVNDPNIVHPRTTNTPERCSPTPERGAPPPPNVVHPTPERCSPITINEPSVEPSRKPKRSSLPVVVDIAELVKAGFDAETAAEFLAVKAQRKAPLTPRAWADHLRESAKAGWTPLAAAEKVMAKTWKGFEASYVRDEIRTPGPPAKTFRERDADSARAKAAVWSGGLLGKDPNTIDMEESHGLIANR